MAQLVTSSFTQGRANPERSAELKRASREVGRLPAEDRREECTSCYNLFVPSSQSTLCRKCRLQCTDS